MIFRMKNPLRSVVAMAIVIAGSSADAQYLAERLVPPQQVAIPALPMTGQPEESRIFGSELERMHRWALPFAPFPGASVLIAPDLRAADWRRPVLDLPMLASEGDPARPSTPAQPVSSRAFASSANPWVVPPLARFLIPNEPVIRPDDDPAAMAAFAQLTLPVALATPNSAPLLRLSAPDPFEQIRIIRLSSTLPDTDDPAASQDRPPLSKLPSVEAPK